MHGREWILSTLGSCGFFPQDAFEDKGLPGWGPPSFEEESPHTQDERILHLCEEETPAHLVMLPVLMQAHSAKRQDRPFGQHRK